MSHPIVMLAPGVFRIPTMRDFINSFAFVDDDGQVTLVDCGLKTAPPRIVAGLAAIGKSPSDVTRIVLTHAHMDHAGGARQMLSATAVPGVEVHEADVEFVRSGHNAPTAQSTAGRMMTRLPGGTFDTVPVVTELTDGQVIGVAGGVRVVHTPGHTPGHVSLLHESSGVLITGDAIFNMAWGMSWPMSFVCTSFGQNKLSAHVLGELEYDVAAFTHGPEIRDHAREAVRGFLRRKS
jgi:glyoxylase-like metal-dependent hydrolase (beta-lactamase superfamily II)